VIGQHFLASPAEAGAMLLETAQNNHIAIIHHGPAKTRDITRTGVVSLLRRRRGSQQNKRQNEKNSEHLIAPYIADGRDQILPRG
jgi:hypothetical protein